MEGLNILFVDDDKSYLALIEAFFEDRRDIKVRLAESGEDALKLFNESPVNLIVTDYNMDRMNGLELARRIRKTSSETPIIMLTGINLSPEFHSMAVEAGISGVVPKSSDLKIILPIINGLFKSPAAIVHSNP